MVSLSAFMGALQQRWMQLQTEQQAKFGGYYYRYQGRSKRFKKNKRRGL